MTVTDNLFDEWGFIKDPGAWNTTVAEQLAAQEGIAQLSDDHWQLLKALRRHYFDIGAVPVMRHLCRDIGMEHHCVSELLDNPRRAWRIAGLPDPGEEARTYLETAEVPD